MSDFILAKFKNGPKSSQANGYRNKHKLTDIEDEELAKIGVRKFKVPPGRAVALAAQGDADADFVEVDGQGQGAPFTPNDPSYSSQWHLPKINADDAWEDTQGDPSIVIAVLDSGVQYDHPDLAPQLIRGPSYVTGVSTSDDDHGHGTAVTGCIAATINNGIGVAGVAPKCKVRVSKILDSNNWGYYSWWSSAIINAADAGVKVINLSVYGTSSNSTLQSAVNYAWNKGVVLVACAGNSGGTTLGYPAACTNVVSVSATASNDTLAGFSSRGTTIDIAAPGASILTTNRGGGYASWNGTSFSSPLTAGAVGLIRSINKNLSASESVAVLLDSANGNSPYDTATSFGAGLLDVDAAVVAAASATPIEEPPPAPVAPGISITSPASGATVSGTVNITVSLSGEQLTTLELKVDGVSKVAGIPVTGSTQVIPWVSSGVSDGSRVISVIVSQTGGATATASRTVTVLNASDAVAPVVTISSPANGTVVSEKGMLKVIASATDNRGVTKMELFINNVKIKTYNSASSFTYNWKYFNAPTGSNTVLAKAYDAAGNVGQASVSVTKTA